MKRVIFHICLGLSVFYALIYLSLQSLDSITLHGQDILVPDLKSFSIYEVEDTLASLQLRFSVVDSGAYNADYHRGAVIEQLPRAGSKVKNNRELKLTVNPKNVSLISLPDYKDRSCRQYISELKAKGFRIGKFIYKKDEHANVVLGVRYQGNQLNVDEKLKKSIKLDLLLGNGQGIQFNMPKLVGLTHINIAVRLQNLSLNKGEFRYDNTVIDTLKSFVYRQVPNEKKEIDLGTFVSLWFTQDSSNIVCDGPDLILQDSLKARLDSILND
jgi:beta-lactam-binding protein with PASTA domain